VLAHGYIRGRALHCNCLPERYKVRVAPGVTKSAGSMPTLPSHICINMRRACSAAAWLLCLTACQTTPAPDATIPSPDAAAVTAPPPPPAPPAPSIDEDRLDALLDAGDQALADERLLTPIDDCAYDYYRAALLVAPDHPAPLHGLGLVADRYIALADQAAQRGQYALAASMLERARIVDATRPGIAETEAMIELRSSAKRQATALDANQLTQHDPAVAQQLERLGARAKAADAWVVIRARNDAEGRWIYQQMANGPGERRIRAELTLGSPPGVELLEIAEVEP
jgi:hypothetical protein